MIPLAGTKKELDYLKKITVETADAVMKETKTKVEYLYGTMIEVPRAAVTADEIAETAEFFSFGTNDLTQMTFGYSRDDVNSFLPDYLKKEILERDPFQSLDIGGVGKLVRHGRRKWPRDQPEPQVRHLRRARRRPEVASSSATRSASTTSAAPPSASPSPASPRPTRRSRRARRTGREEVEEVTPASPLCSDVIKPSGRHADRRFLFAR